MNPHLRRELRVAFSRRAQPVWFRVVKWLCPLTGVVCFHDRAWFWLCMAFLAAAGLGLHMVYRWKTRGWKNAWGGWSDLEAGRD